MDFKFVSHRLWSEAQNILRQHIHIIKNLGIKHGNRLKHENEAEGHGPSASASCLSLFPHLLVKILFYACVDEGCSGSLTIVCEK